jgi:hypothetical protein
MAKTNELATGCGVFLEKRTVFPLVKKFSQFYGIRKFIAKLTMINLYFDDQF